MNYPVWDLPFAHGMLIAVVAILHVYVSHFAVGGGLFLVMTESLAYRRGDSAMLGYVRDHSRFFLLLTLVFGAISGVGIWFTIGLINPAGTSSLIHAFVWGWAIEWVFFFVEIAAAMIYYYGWDRLDRKTHLIVGWVYFGAAWLSMVVINAILSFQLTPGDWLQSRGFWDGVFNPTYWSSLLVRSFFAVGVAGLFAIWTASRLTDPQLRATMVRLGGLWALIGLVVSALGTIWWWDAIPEAARMATEGGMPIATALLGWAGLLALFLALLLIVGPLLVPRVVAPPAAAVLLLVGLALMGTGEWLREAVRKPFVIYDYLYSNGLRPEEVEGVREEGIAAASLWIDPASHDDQIALGHELFRTACQNCHALTGYNGIHQRIEGWEEEYTAAMIQRLEYTRRRMPPWAGTEDEAVAVAAYLHGTLPPSAQDRLDPPTDGAEVFTRRCASCHTVDGFRGIRELVEGLTAEDLDEYMQDMESDEMPPFTAGDEQRLLLAEWLEGIGEGELTQLADADAGREAIPGPGAEGGAR